MAKRGKLKFVLLRWSTIKTYILFYNLGTGTGREQNGKGTGREGNGTGTALNGTERERDGVERC